MRDTFADNPERQREYGADEVLLGSEGILDSYDAMLFLVNVDHLLSGKTGRNIVLVSDAALSRKDTPFRSLGTLADYVEEIVRS